MIRQLASLVIALTITMVLGACAAERSTEAFCKVYNEEKQEYLAKYGGNPEDGLEALGNALGAMSAWVPMFDRMAKHAPDEIQADVAHIRDSLRASQQNAGNAASDPLGSLAGSLVAGMMMADSWSRLEVFVEANCVSLDLSDARFDRTPPDLSGGVNVA
jgi:hypothetical protein